jgi:hypothetical protein
VTGKVIQLRARPVLEEPDSQVWTCGCGNQDWICHAGGDVRCNRCFCISSIVKVVRIETPREPIDHG